ncbi:hypothetical protein A0128_02060 [Leptospira tipperaryensis]|uniref:Uncharacterized protein n=1 Tax=Leptospira tipperaryensis TaxID=2564040 RepID=A0A1D7UT18_9LEPT|nr:hypothetical protein A0128_02060 [Leptospira tipperaryensis]
MIQGFDSKGGIVPRKVGTPERKSHDLISSFKTDSKMRKWNEKGLVLNQKGRNSEQKTYGKFATLKMNRILN